MIKENTPLLSDDFLDEVAKEINQMFGGQNQIEEYSLNEEASI
ncbi:bacitracin ABC transporter ATP-binding protein [Bacillus sp. EB600]|nr:bacitracin ABC transporter ATP-binding protein [Bacillus sp. EB600]MCQ6277695.1 bacitracin ABC transporter ATP-binding protein [Bacillus sp. EB600]